MINTYHTSVAPPPVPPRLSKSDPVLYAAAPPSQGHSKSLLRFLVGVTLLHLFLSVGGFIYLEYQTGKREMGKEKDELSQSEETEALLLSATREMSHKALARMVVEQPSYTARRKSEAGCLKWDMNHSLRRNINYYHGSWLTILDPGDYYVYSRVTFSKEHAVRPLGSSVKFRENETGEAKVVMQAYCSLNKQNASIPRLCSATQGEVLTLKKGNQLTVWVDDLSLVDYNDKATSFGMYKL